MEEYQMKLIETYQCPGCVCGYNIECFEPGEGIECSEHIAGTIILGIGKIYLGLPTGFNRIGQMNEVKIKMFEGLHTFWGYDKYNVPVWKHKDEHGNTLVRGISPRINQPFIHIFQGDCLAEIDCLEITSNDINAMD